MKYRIMIERVAGFPETQVEVTLTCKGDEEALQYTDMLTKLGNLTVVSVELEEEDA